VATANSSVDCFFASSSAEVAVVTFQEKACIGAPGISASAVNSISVFSSLLVGGGEGISRI
jgi:hypothetical protein